MYEFGRQGNAIGFHGRLDPHEAVGRNEISKSYSLRIQHCSLVTVYRAYERLRSLLLPESVQHNAYKIDSQVLSRRSGEWPWYGST